MFDTVIVGVDGRSGGRDAVALARRLAAPGAHVVLAVIYGNVSGVAGAAALVLEAQLDEAERILAEQARAWPGCETKTVYCTSVGRGLHELAADREADLIVVGSCHHGRAGRVLLGDDTREAMFGAPCALAIAPRGLTEAGDGIETVTIGFDGRQESQAALAAAREVAARCHADLRALWVVSREDVRRRFPLPADWPEGTHRLLDEAKAILDDLGDVAGEAVAGGPREELMRVAADSDLVILGSRGYGPLGALLHGSVSSYLERHAAAGLLVVPRPARGPGAAEDASSAPVAAHA